MGRIVRFAIASAMRRQEICRIRWSGVDVGWLAVPVHDRKDPREKDSNDPFVPLLDPTGFDALRLTSAAAVASLVDIFVWATWAPACCSAVSRADTQGPPPSCWRSWPTPCRCPMATVSPVNP